MTICSEQNRLITYVFLLLSYVNRFCRMFSCILLLVCYVNANSIRDKSQKPIPITRSPIPLERCSQDFDVVKYRNSLIDCTNGTFYLCGYDHTGGFIVEDCLPDKQCTRGK